MQDATTASKPRNRKLTIAVLLVLFALAAIGLWVSRRSRPLVDIAKPVFEMHLADGGRRFYNPVGPLWLTPHTILYSKFSPDRKLYEYDIRTHSEKLLPGLTVSRNAMSEEVIDAEGVSPNGRWYACSDRWGEFHIMEVQSGKEQTFPSRDDGAYRRILWSPDSRYCYEIYTFNQGRHCVTTHDLSALNKPVFTADKDFLQNSEDAEGMVSGQIALCIKDLDLDDTNRRSAHLTISRISVPGPNSNPIPLRNLTLDGLLALDHKVSPDGARIAWMVVSPEVDRVGEFMWRFVKSLHSKSTKRTRLLISDSNGENMHEIGYLPNSRDEEGPIYTLFEWLPDSHQMSLTYGDRIYVLPVP